jgi:hypothetical protein
MNTKGVSLSVLLQVVVGISPVLAHPLFLIKAVPKGTVLKGSTDAKVKHPTQQLKGAGNNDETLFCLPRSVAQIDMTFVLYAKKPPPTSPFMEAVESADASKDKKTDSSCCCCTKGSTDPNQVVTKVTPDLSQLQNNSQHVAALAQNSPDQALKPGSKNQPTKKGTKSAQVSPSRARAATKPAAATAPKPSGGGGAKQPAQAAPIPGGTSPAAAGSPPQPSQSGGLAETISTQPTGSGKVLGAPRTFPSLKINGTDVNAAEDDYVKVACPFIVVIPDNAKIQIKSVPDEDLVFKVVLGDLHGLVSDINKASLTKDSSGIVTGIDTEFHDRTADIIADIGVTAADGAAFAAKFAPLAAGPGVQAPPPAPNFVKAATIKVTKIVDLNSEGLTTPVDITDVREAVVNCLKRMGYSPEDFQAPPDQQFNLSMPQLTLQYDRPLLQTKSSDILYEQGFEGLVIREPQKTEIKLMAANNFLSPKCIDQREMIAQTGSLSAIKIQKRSFSKTGRTVTLSDFGGVTTLSATSTSPIKEITGALRQIGDSLNGISVPQGKKK